MDQAELINTFIEKLQLEIGESTKRRILVETENTILKRNLETQAKEIELLKTELAAVSNSPGEEVKIIKKK